jgi:hypothetical protein
MISFELIDDEELEVLRLLIDKERWDTVLSEFGSEMELERKLGMMPHEFTEWKNFWLGE